MPQCDRLIRRLEKTREMSEKMLAAFESPEDWCRQVVPGTNHALWFAGHMALTDNYFISRVAPGSEKQFEGWDKLFGMGSNPTNDPDDYPPVAEVLDTMRERRRALVELLKGRSDAELAGPPAAGASDFLPDLASVYEMTPWHEAMHLGQVTVVRRALGNRPLFDPAPVEATA
jgi:DinB superfamily